MMTLLNYIKVEVDRTDQARLTGTYMATTIPCTLNAIPVPGTGLDPHTAILTLTIRMNGHLFRYLAVHMARRMITRTEECLYP